MARKRMIDPEFWSDEQIGHWSVTARLCYIGLWSLADDQGRFKADVGYVRGQIFPYDAPKSLKFGICWIQVSTKLVLYEVNGQKYGYIPNFLKYQRIDRPTPSKLPSPPSDKIDEYSTNALRSLDHNIIQPKLIEAKLIKDKQKSEEQLNLEHILATMDGDIKNFKTIGNSKEWIKKMYLDLGVPEADVDKALGKLF